MHTMCSRTAPAIAVLAIMLWTRYSRSPSTVSAPLGLTQAQLATSASKLAEAHRETVRHHPERDHDRGMDAALTLHLHDVSATNIVKHTAVGVVVPCLLRLSCAGQLEVCAW